MALKQGHDFIAITDHHFDGMGEPCGSKGRACDEQLCATYVEQCRNETRLLCIPGMEITGRVHMLAIGIQHGIDASLSVKEWVEQTHRQGGLAIAAHPFQRTTRYTEAELFQSGLDASECWRERFDGEGWIQPDMHGLPCVYNSDTHDISNAHNISGEYNICDGVVKTLDDLKAVIKANLCHPPW